jgi:excisionase family DNA binding protein
LTERLLTARELAAYIGLKPATVLDKWERGEFPGYRFGRAVRFDLDEILALGRRGEERASEPPSTPGKSLKSVVLANRTEESR